MLPPIKNSSGSIPKKVRSAPIVKRCQAFVAFPSQLRLKQVRSLSDGYRSSAIVLAPLDLEPLMTAAGWDVRPSRRIERYTALDFYRFLAAFGVAILGFHEFAQLNLDTGLGWMARWDDPLPLVAFAHSARRRRRVSI
jgi:hypothetical protein